MDKNEGEASDRNTVSGRTRGKQPTIDGKPSPGPSSLKQKKKYACAGGSTHTYYDKLVKQQHPSQKRTKGPRTPAQELVWQEKNRLKYTSEERALINLLDWHETCPGSQIFDREKELSDEEPDDEHRLFSTSLKSHKPLDHHDE